jgi:hypothetical protein
MVTGFPEYHPPGFKGERYVKMTFNRFEQQRFIEACRVAEAALGTSWSQAFSGPGYDKHGSTQVEISSALAALAELRRELGG